MPKQIKATILNPDDEVVTRGILREELLKQQTLIINSFVTKQEWARDMDQIMGALKSMQEDLAASLYRQQEHDWLFEKLDKRLHRTEVKLGIASQVGA